MTSPLEFFNSAVTGMPSSDREVVGLDVVGFDVGLGVEYSTEMVFLS